MSLYKTVLFFLACIAMIVGSIGCGASHVSIDEAYHELEPVKQLELPEQLTDNLVISVNNVADEYNSYKNRAEIFINDKLVNPNWNVSNIDQNYIFSLKVKPGYYDIKGFYYAYIGWGEEKYEIKSLSPVRVTHEAITHVEYNLVKKNNGEPVDENMVFSVKTVDFDSPEAKSIISEKASNLEPAGQGPVVLQINTVPENAKIILDDRIVGQAPLKISVEPDTDHVLQITAKGYNTFTKLLDKALLAGKEKLVIIQELKLKQTR